LYRFWTRLLQSSSGWFKTRFIKVRRPGQVKDWHLGPESKTCFLMGKIRDGHMKSWSRLLARWM
jgi:hypothetical protein